MATRLVPVDEDFDPQARRLRVWVEDDTPPVGGWRYYADLAQAAQRARLAVVP